MRRRPSFVSRVTTKAASAPVTSFTVSLLTESAARALEAAGEIAADPRPSHGAHVSFFSSVLSMPITTAAFVTPTGPSTMTWSASPLAAKNSQLAARTPGKEHRLASYVPFFAVRRW